MEDEVFLNLVVQNILPSSIQQFMMSWLSQECKDFRIVFIDKDLSNEQKVALKYAQNFASVLWPYKQMAYAVEDKKNMPKAKMTKVLKDTSELPNDKYEVSKLKSKLKSKSNVKKQKESSVKANAKIILEKPLQTYNPYLESNTIKNISQHKDSIENNKVDDKKEKVFFKIIIPNYNNMPYIKKCLDSILEQTFQDFKIIIVDDLSTDGSDKFCKAYIKKYPSKIVFLRLNKKGCAGACRNIGINYDISSSYTIFVDSDDWLYNKHVLNDLHNFILKNNFPMMIRAPMLNFYGKTDQSKKDKLTIYSKMRMYMNGPGPGRTIISSKLKHKFVENRSKNNDCIWFLKCINQLDLKQIKLYDKIWYVYNRISATSCQNSINKISDINCIYDSTVNFVEDLKKIEFKDSECCKIKQWEIDKRMKNINNNITCLNLLQSSYVIVCNSKEYSDFCKLFSSYGISPLPKAFIGCTDKKLFSNSWRIRQSHINLIEYAKKSNLPFIVVFESDAYPCINIVDKLSKYAKFIPNDANMALFGWTKIRNQQQTDYAQPFVKITKQIVDGAHSYVIFNRAYNAWLNLMYTMKSNNTKDNFIYPADDYIFRDIGNAYMINYPLFIQYNKSPSIHNHIAYNFNGCSTIPPKGFK